MNIVKYIVSLLFIGLFIVGCGEKKEEEKTHVTLEKKATAEAIEVVENQNYKEEKVATKVKDANESKVFYYDYNKDNSSKSDTSTEATSQTPLDAVLHVRSPYEHVEISMLVSKLSKKFIVKCSACHDDYANGIIGPSLLSKDNIYIYETIMQYKKGKKENILMKELVHNLDEGEIRALSDEIYTFNQEVKKIREKQQ